MLQNLIQRVPKLNIWLWCLALGDWNNLQMWLSLVQSARRWFTGFKKKNRRWFGDYGALRFIFSPVARIEMSLFSFSFFSIFLKEAGLWIEPTNSGAVSVRSRPHRVRLHWSVWPQQACGTLAFIAIAGKSEISHIWSLVLIFVTFKRANLSKRNGCLHLCQF